MLVEAIACSAEDAIIAEHAGVDRLEICSAMVVGGLTPSIGTLTSIRKATTLPLMAMIRPRASGFCYSNYEFDAMLDDVDALLRAGANGVVFGLLNDVGEVDLPRCRAIVDHAGPHQTVFHRAFDALADPEQALETLIDLGVTRILTSGSAPTALQGVDMIRKLIDLAAGRIEILAGGGVRPDSVHDIVALTHTTQVHLGPFVPRFDRSIEASEAASRAFGPTYPIADADTLSRVVNSFRTS